jgi:hypothetical protein
MPPPTTAAEYDELERLEQDYKEEVIIEGFKEPP